MRWAVVGWQEFDGGEVSRLEGEGRRARGQRAAGGSGGSALEVKWIALCECLLGEWGLRGWREWSLDDRALQEQGLEDWFGKERVKWK